MVKIENKMADQDGWHFGGNKKTSKLKIDEKSQLKQQIK
jgi:hypothetical protein